MPVLFLIFALLGLGASAAAWHRNTQLGAFNVPYFLIGWLAGELPLQLLAVQAAGVALFAALGALDTWPGVAGLALTFISWGYLLAGHLRAIGARRALSQFAAQHNLQPALGEVSPLHGFANPFKFTRRGVRKIRDVEYGPALPGDRGGRNKLDIVLPEGESNARMLRPALLQIHGGGWIIGDKREQGQPLMAHLAARGWVCFAPNYRLSPQATFPDHIVDVKRAIVWVREHAAEYGADPDFLCITGGSAGGHLCALAALTPNNPRFQPGFEGADTRVAAAAPFYGVYDWLDRAGDRGDASMQKLLAERVLKCSPQSEGGLWEVGSPISHVSANAPPFLIVQGTHDSLVFAQEAQTFARALQAQSKQPALLCEIPGAQHAFDVFHSVRCAYAVRVVTAFLESVRAGRGA